MKKLTIIFSVFVMCFVFSEHAFGQLDVPSCLRAPHISNNPSFIESYRETDAYFNSRAFAQWVFPGSNLGPVKFFLNSPETITNLATQPGNIYAASFTPNGIWWGGVNSSNDLIRIDTVTGSRTIIGTMTLTGTLTGMAYDLTTSTMFVTSVPGATTNLYTVNLTNAQTTLIGTASGLLIDIACSNSGQLYGVDIAADVFGSVNKTTGAFTVIGPIGFDAQYAQGLSWDPSTDSCWYAAFNNTTFRGELRKVNVQTGATTLIGPFQGDAEIDGFAIRAIPLPQAPVLVSPLNGATGVSLTPILDWNDVPGADSYRVNVSTDSNFTNTVVNQTGLTASQYGIPPSTLQNGVTYYWRVNATGAGGTSPWSVVWRFTTGLVGVETYDNEIPKEFKLYNNFPNPFNPSTTIKYSIPEVSKVSLTLFNLLGEEVTRLVDEEMTVGNYTAEFIATNLPSGIYFYKLQAGTFTETKKMILMN